jgi:hypothetical protein
MKLSINALNDGPAQRQRPGSDGHLHRAIRICGACDLGPHRRHTACAGVVPGSVYDSFARIDWLAAETDRILPGTGTSVTLLPYRCSADCASSCESRRVQRWQIRRGVASRWSGRREFAAIGAPFENPGAITDGYLTAIVEAWTTEVIGRAMRGTR